MNNNTPNKHGYIKLFLFFTFFVSSFGSIGSIGAANVVPMPFPQVVAVNPSQPTIYNPNEYIKINLNHITQERNLCVPTCASMMLFKFGWNYAPRQLKLMTLNKPYYGPAAPFSDYTGMKFSELISALRSKAGIRWTEKLYPGTYDGYLMGLNDIKNSLRRGYPVMIGLYYGTYGHVVAVCGFDEKNKVIIVNEPLLRSPGLKTIRYNDIQGTFWSNRAFNSTMRSVVYMY